MAHRAEQQVAAVERLVGRAIDPVHPRGLEGPPRPGIRTAHERVAGWPEKAVAGAATWTTTRFGGGVSEIGTGLLAEEVVPLALVFADLILGVGRHQELVGAADSPRDGHDEAVAVTLARIQVAGIRGVAEEGVRGVLDAVDREPDAVRPVRGAGRPVADVGVTTHSTVVCWGRGTPRRAG